MITSGWGLAGLIMPDGLRPINIRISALAVGSGPTLCLGGIGGEEDCQLRWRKPKIEAMIITEDGRKRFNW
jgi:hypothetical protein